MINEQSIKEAFAKIKEDIEIIKIEIEELNNKISQADSYEEITEVKKWRGLLEDGKRKVRWGGNGREREWEKKRKKERQTSAKIFYHRYLYI